MVSFSLYGPLDEHARTRVLPLQAVGRGRRGAQLLDDDGGGAHRDLSEDLRDAWERLRETAAEFGDQRIYASHNSIMFSRKSCYFFVRPKKSFLEVCVFLGRPLKAPQVRRSAPSSKSKFFSIIQIRHRDEVEAPVTEWIREAYEQSESLATRSGRSEDPPKKAKRADRA